MAIYITGDTHGDFRKIYEFWAFAKTTTDDIMIILGDAGINYYLDKWEEYTKRELSVLPITLFCIHGNHEERPFKIDTYEEIEWHGGIAYAEPDYPNLIFAKDGEIYDFNGKKAMAIGGAYSVDKWYRLQNNLPWFETEQPDDTIMSFVEKQLDRVNWKIDYIFSHTAPLKYEPTDVFLPNIDQDNVDKTTEKWLDKIEDKLDYEHWFLGHYHCDRDESKVTIMFNAIENLTEYQWKDCWL